MVLFKTWFHCSKPSFILNIQHVMIDFSYDYNHFVLYNESPSDNKFHENESENQVNQKATIWGNITYYQDQLNHVTTEKRNHHYKS